MVWWAFGDTDAEAGLTTQNIGEMKHPRHQVLFPLFYNIYLKAAPFSLSLYRVQFTRQELSRSGMSAVSSQQAQWQCRYWTYQTDTHTHK